MLWLRGRKGARNDAVGRPRSLPTFLLGAAFFSGRGVARPPRPGELATNGVATDGEKLFVSVRKELDTAALVG